MSQNEGYDIIIIIIIINIMHTFIKYYVYNDIYNRR